MKPPTINSSVLLEVLVQEVEALKKTKHEYRKFLERTDKYLRRIENIRHQPLPIDTKPLEKWHLQFMHNIDKYFILPKRITFIAMLTTLLLCFSLVANYKLYYYSKAYKQYAHYLERRLKQEGIKP